MPALPKVTEVLREISPDCPFNKSVSCDFMSKYRTADGTCNNIRNPTFGAAQIPVRRFLPAYYDDRKYEMLFFTADYV